MQQPSPYSVLRPQSLRSQAAEQIREAIVTGRLGPGSMHSESSIAGEMGISRTPVREALLQLVSEGLVEFVPQRGVRISPLEPAHLVEVFQFRAALESHCAATLAREPHAETVAVLERELARQKEIIASDDHLQWVRANMDFHMALVEAVGNRLMIEAMPAPASHTMRIGYRMVARKERMVESLDEHAAIVDAIRRRDQECARTLATDHLRVTTALMNKLFAQLNLKGPTGEDGAGGEQ